VGDSSCIQTTGVGCKENNPDLALQSEARLISRFSAYSVPSRDVCLEPSLQECMQVTLQMASESLACNNYDGSTHACTRSVLQGGISQQWER
jgi:hypothetical protein